MARILIVDDQKSVLLTLQALLEQNEHIVTACSNSIDALDRLSYEPFDLMITDAIMPVGGSGYSLIKTIRQLPKIAKLPIILLTGKREREDVEKGIAAGANDYVVKPVDPELLLAKIVNLLVSTPKETTQFAEAPTQYKAEWESSTSIVAVSELGFVLQSNVSPIPGSLMKINSSIFSDIGISTVKLRIVACEEVKTPEPHFRVQTNFVGLSEKELTPLRLWIRTKQKHR